MGYETKMYVVRKYSFGVIGNESPSGQELACIDLCKCGYEGAVASLISNHTKHAVNGEKPPFGLYTRGPDRQNEAVELLQEIANTESVSFSLSKEEIEALASDIEDGQITEDCYGDWLGVIEIDDMIQALEEDLKGEEKYRRFQWALVLLKSIKETYPEGGLKVITFGH
ncbi:hypothetical protein C4577_03065 [Candidatus Parcubacteria bacterium]|nr:MAG: hypothetical protein C4577_03065 [Candidatus Parcubacteria bacterium]